MPADPVTLAGIGDEAAPDLRGQLAALDAASLSAIELRTVDGVPLSEVDDATFALVARSISQADKDVVCVDSRIGGRAGRSPRRSRTISRSWTC
ncbi:hypothetical protein [Actinophytocola oryzae]|uniref:Uncharacterized protein n=1 Tax=Actinophytocola oryzae TaxID=502181 RepID=A0A4R7W4P3_9PSEU|nr:hypothetical protein [Actinophytocola oryzae]TDV57502.1 hypothetical protein CLV71_101373 [Actinophytocola oryzae]